MDYQKWMTCDWAEAGAYAAFEQEAIDDLKAQLEAENLVLVKTLPNTFYFGAVVANASNSKWLHVVLPSVKDGNNWFENVSLRRMSSERDWKGDCFHYCTFDAIGKNITVYMADEYDEEAF